MRLFTPASPRLTAAAALLAAASAAAVPAAAVPAHADPGAPLPACTAPDDHTFPLTTRLHGGPAAYEAGGGYGTWYLDLTNTTSRSCEGIHPVVVLVDEKRALEPSQPLLEFYDGDRPHPVELEATDRDELIGAFGEGAGESAGEDAVDDFPGFTVGPGKTLTVKVRLALTSDAEANEVTANAAVVQRRGGDGEWIGQSNDYRFRIRNADSTDAPSADPSAESSADPSAESSADPSGESSAGQDTAPTDPTAPAPTDAPTPHDRATAPPSPDELAGTGPGRTDAALGAAALLVTVGGAAVLLARRRR
ncbi:hypothetical protein [Streptomyces sp. MA25(2023)]|uniref:hypothetical protein n=1 Tax=Streptomyces sp. MA25(2023) TaxID=3055078 RepID=UPI0025B1EE65|nr:hypothetical protein [Streptomyces sp. MA25(2023)]MDN3251237.1 hypothetical protein [Streptomyces sp. MA25(2023)]